MACGLALIGGQSRQALGVEWLLLWVVAQGVEPRAVEDLDVGSDPNPKAQDALGTGREPATEGAMIVANLGSTIASRLATVATTVTVGAAANAFSKLGVGILVVSDGDGPILGVVSKSDLVMHLAREGTAAEPLTSVMTRDVITCSVQDELQTVWQRMVDRRLQNIPVLDDRAKLCGVLDIRDALRILLQEEEYEEQLLVNYVAGIGYQ